MGEQRRRSWRIFRATGLLKQARRVAPRASPGVAEDGGRCAVALLVRLAHPPPSDTPKCRASKHMTKHPKPAVLTVVAVTAYAVAAYSVVVPLVDPCGWFRADAQSLPAPVGHRQPTPADVASTDPSQKNPSVSPADRALDRALNNVCRGCSPPAAVGKLPRYDVAVACGAARDGPDKDTCRKD